MRVGKQLQAAKKSNWKIGKETPKQESTYSFSWDSNEGVVGIDDDDDDDEWEPIKLITSPGDSNCGTDETMLRTQIK